MTAQVRGAMAILSLVLLHSCSTGKTIDVPEGHSRGRVHLFSAERAIQDEWQSIPIRGETDYRLTAAVGRVAIRAMGQNSASGLIRRLQIDPIRCPQIEWSWRVDQLQESADIRIKEKEDVAASIFILFGDPGLLLSPKKVPALRYVWTNGRIDIESVVDSPYLPGVVKSIVVRSGLNQPGWFVESRNLLRDFERAFGHAPTEAIQAIALFTDNDQTKEPVIAYYEWARAVCGTDQS